MTRRIMPLAGDYSAAVQNPKFCFTDAILQQSSVRKNKIGQPFAMSGQFSVVFSLMSPTGHRYAIKCFTHDAPNQLRRYEIIHDGLSSLRPRWAADFVFQSSGIKIKSGRYPILRMNWVEGQTLLTWIDGNVRDSASVLQLAGRFEGLVKELSDAGIAHGDLQHGNILVEPSGHIRLVDYDGLYIPGRGLEQFPPSEVGLPDYQPPGRSINDYGPVMDRFSSWIILLSLRALAADSSLWDRLNPARGEYLLLDRNDFARPDSSPRLEVLFNHASVQVRHLAEQVHRLLRLPLIDIPDPVRLSDAKRTLSGAHRRPATPLKPSWVTAIERTSARGSEQTGEPRKAPSTTGTPASANATGRGRGVSRPNPTSQAPSQPRTNANTRPAPGPLPDNLHGRIDRHLIGWAVALSVTVAVPWLIGLYVLEGTSFYPYDENIFDPLAREITEYTIFPDSFSGQINAYFFPRYLGGVVVIGFLLAAALILRSWRGRRAMVSLGLAISAACIVAVPNIWNLWDAAEAETLKTLHTAPFPIAEYAESKQIDLCWSETATFGVDSWQAAIVGRSCGILVIYRGWHRVGQHSLPSAWNVANVSDHAFLSLAVTPEETYVVVNRRVVRNKDSQYIFVLSLTTAEEQWAKEFVLQDDGSEWWPYDDGSSAPLFLIDNVLRIVQVKGDRERVVGIDVPTGEVVWVVQCSEKYNTHVISYREGLVECVGKGEVRKFTFDNSGVLEPAN